MEYDYFEEYDSTEDPEILHCFCYGHCPFDDDSGICEVATGGKCFASVVTEEEIDGTENSITSFGCLSEKMSALQCKGSLVPHLKSKSIQCCDDADFCNKHLYPSSLFEGYAKFTKSVPFIVIMSSIGACVIFLSLLFIYLNSFRKKVNKNPEETNNASLEQTQQNTLPGETAQTSFELSNGSTGSGYSNLMHVRTISKQLEMGKLIQKGQFGEVFIAKWRGEKVAVKIFTDEQIWLRETDIYQTVLMRQENILGFIAADLNFVGEKAQMVLITEYHELGSLNAYLNKNTLTPQGLLLASKSIARGLAHLHMEILGVPGKDKPCILHRDFNSKNILIKLNGECCIADFGNAAKYDSKTNTMNLPVKQKYSTMRYWAPEILNDTIDVQNCDSSKMADIYAFGLVLWEMSRRCTIDDKEAERYSLPYQDHVSVEPTLDEMREIVCNQKVRPAIPDILYNIPVLKIIPQLIQEMWAENSAARLTALRIKKSLNSLSSQDRTVINIADN